MLETDLSELEIAKSTIANQTEQIIRLDSKVASLEDKVLILLKLLEVQSVKKDSRNSSMPPSSDITIKKTKSLRPPSLLKSGGQLGHIGTTLEQRPNPDKIIELRNEFCTNCGTSLKDAHFILKSRRQVIEIPPILPIYEEFRQFCCACPNCQQEQLAAFPLGVNAPIQYGSTVESLVSYLSVYQYVPFARLQNMFGQVFSLPLSQGTVGNILERAAVKCEGVYQIIKTKISESTVIGSDETGAKVNGDKWWMWVWQNVKNTFIVPSDNRGSKTIDKVWENGLPDATIVSDRWAAQLKVKSQANQLCLPHLQRDTNFLEESEKHPFATQFKELLSDIFKIRQKLVQLGKPYQTDDLEAIDLEKRINKMLLITIDEQLHLKTRIFQNSMLKHRNHLLPCLYNLDIPPDNNGSERAIRNIKVKQKVSGQFKTGQYAFSVIRSVIDTLRKRNVEVLPCLNLIIKLQPV
jgi:transposase